MDTKNVHGKLHTLYFPLNEHRVLLMLSFLKNHLPIYPPGCLLMVMNVDFVSPEVFFFNLHLLKALKLHLYRTKVQWDITKKVLNSKI